MLVQINREKSVGFQMDGKMLKFTLSVIILSGIMVGAHILKDYRNKQFVLTSVYDAMKSNARQDMEKLFNRNEINHDSRNKRNTGEKPIYYDNLPPSGTQSEVSVHSSSDLVCTRRGDHSGNKVAVEEHTSSGFNSAMALKYGLMLLAALLLPIALFKMTLLPMALLFGLKAATLLNSFLLGSLLYKFKSWKSQQNNSNNNNNNQNNDSNSATTSRPTIKYTRPASTVINEETDYIDIAGPSEDLSRALELLKKRTKNW